MAEGYVKVPVKRVCMAEHDILLSFYINRIYHCEYVAFPTKTFALVVLLSEWIMACRRCPGMSYSPIFSRSKMLTSGFHSQHFSLAESVSILTG